MRNKIFLWAHVTSPTYVDDVCFVNPTVRNSKKSLLLVRKKIKVLPGTNNKGRAQQHFLRQLKTDFMRSYVQDDDVSRPSWKQMKDIACRCCCADKFVDACTQAGLAPALMYLVDRFPAYHIGELSMSAREPIIIKIQLQKENVLVLTQKQIRAFTISPDGRTKTHMIFDITTLHRNKVAEQKSNDPCTCTSSFSIYYTKRCS